MSVELHEGDCRAVLRSFPADHFDSVVTDPPYGLSKEPDIAEVLKHWLAGDDYEHRAGGFMGKTWDSFVPGPTYWREIFRVMKPGAHLLAFGGTRTYDLLVIAIRMAGFEIRDQLAWMYGTGFPKGKSQLKPAQEPIVLARKPFKGSAKKCVEEHGTGALNIDGCRIATDPEDAKAMERANTPGSGRMKRGGSPIGTFVRSNATGAMDTTQGRWPANVVLSHVQSAWYTLRNDTPEEVIEAVHAYYGVDKALRALRSGDPGYAVRDQKETLLLPGVLWTEPEREDDGPEGGDGVLGVRQNLQDASGLGQEREAEVLHEEVQGQSKHKEQEPARGATHRRGPSEDAGRGDGEVPAGELVSMEGRDVSGQRVPSRHGRDVAGAAEVPGSADDQGQVHIGASGRRRRKARSSSSEERDRSPHERSEGRQPPGQPGGSGAGSTHQRAPGSREGASTTSSGEPAAPRRKPRLEVEAGRVPEGWQRYFVFVADRGCELRGTKRVNANQSSRPGGGKGYANTENNGILNPGKGGVVKASTADADGKETVEDWDCHPECAVRLLDEQSAPKMHSAGRARTKEEGTHSGDNEIYGKGLGGPAPRFGDSGGASRFFYCAKAPKRERNKGCDALYWTKDGKPLTEAEWEALPEKERRQGNIHVTVKPVSLMRWLVRLITPPGGKVLDSFMGSGSTGVACREEGFDFTGIELEESSFKIAQNRIAGSR